MGVSFERKRYKLKKAFSSNMKLLKKVNPTNLLPQAFEGWLRRTAWYVTFDLYAVVFTKEMKYSQVS